MLLRVIAMALELTYHYDGRTHLGELPVDLPDGIKTLFACAAFRIVFDPRHADNGDRYYNGGKA